MTRSGIELVVGIKYSIRANMKRRVGFIRNSLFKTKIAPLKVFFLLLLILLYLLPTTMINTYHGTLP